MHWAYLQAIQTKPCKSKLWTQPFIWFSIHGENKGRVHITGHHHRSRSHVRDHGNHCLPLHHDHLVQSPAVEFIARTRSYRQLGGIHLHRRVSTSGQGLWEGRGDVRRCSEERTVVQCAYVNSKMEKLWSDARVHALLPCSMHQYVVSFSF